MSSLADRLRNHYPHTPGPWRECGADRNGCQCGNVWSIPSDGPIATAFLEDESIGMSLPLDRMKENARLIAAAPQLLQLLTEAVDYAEHLPDPDRRDAFLARVEQLIGGNNE